MSTKKVIVAFTLGGSAGRAGQDIGTASVRHFQSASVCLPVWKPIAESGTSG